jgi:hypothetical protein
MAKIYVNTRKKVRKYSPDKTLIREYKLNSIILSEMFKYSTANSFRNSAKYHDILEGVNSLIEYIKEKDRIE